MKQSWKTAKVVGICRGSARQNALLEESFIEYFDDFLQEASDRANYQLTFLSTAFNIKVIVAVISAIFCYFSFPSLFGHQVGVICGMYVKLPLVNLY